jgi:hypothetical protein
MIIMKKNNVIYLLAIAIAVILSGCATFEKQKSRAELFYRTYPNELAPICADAFPVKQIMLPGKAVVTHDTTIIPGPQLKCPPDAAGKTTTLNCPPNKTIRDAIYKTDTMVLENTARVDQYRQELLTCGTTTEAQEKQIEQLKAESIKKLWWIIGLSVALAGSVALRFISFKPTLN